MYSYVNSLFICLDSIYVTCAEIIDKATEVISKKTYTYNMPINNINHIYNVNRKNHCVCIECTCNCSKQII